VEENMAKKVLVEIAIDEGRWDPTWDDGDPDTALQNAVQNYLENCPEWPDYFSSIRALSRPMNMYKIVFIGVQQDYDYVVVAGASAEDREEAQRKVPKRPVRSIYQTYIFEQSGELAIKTVKDMAQKQGIEVEDLTEVSLNISTQAIGVFMREKL
jgi:hypothetical protein